MARDRFIHFFTGAPDVSAITNDLGEFLNGYSAELSLSKENSQRIIVTFSKRGIDLDERWFEVYVAIDNIDVITRQQDDFVSAVADGYARRIACHFHGKAETGHE